MTEKLKKQMLLWFTMTYKTYILEYKCTIILKISTTIYAMYHKYAHIKIITDCLLKVVKIFNF